MSKKHAAIGLALICVLLLGVPTAQAAPPGASGDYKIVASSFLGGGLDDAVVGARIQSDGTIVLALNFGPDLVRPRPENQGGGHGKERPEGRLLRGHREELTGIRGPASTDKTQCHSRLACSARRRPSCPHASRVCSSGEPREPMVCPTCVPILSKSFSSGPTTAPPPPWE